MEYYKILDKNNISLIELDSIPEPVSKEKLESEHADAQRATATLHGR